MMLLALAFLSLAVGSFWLTTVHPARNVLRLRWTLVSFFLVLGLLSIAVPLALQAGRGSLAGPPIAVMGSR